MGVQSLKMDWRYDPVDLDWLIAFAEEHDVERGGRYDADIYAPSIIVWSHSWIIPSCKEESTAMCILKFDRTRSSLVGFSILPGFDLEVALSELSILEKGALGTVVYGDAGGCVGE
jgi:hypothetical protein